MTRPGDNVIELGGARALHWLAAGCMVVAIHGGIVWTVLHERARDLDTSPAGAMTIELAPIAVARADVPDDVPTGPDQVRSDAAPEVPKTAAEKPEAETAPQVVPREEAAPLVKAPDPEPLPIEEPDKKPPVETAPPASAPSVAVPTTAAVKVESDRKDVRAAAVQQGTPGSKQSVAMPRWTAKLVEQIERNKRYPDGAQARRREGVVQVAFVIDRGGRLVDVRVATSSGSDVLDAAAVDLLKRSAPFPPLPADFGDERIDLVIPLHFKLR